MNFWRAVNKIYLIPTYLDESNTPDFIAPMVKEVVKNTTQFLVENVRTARRFISSLKLEVDISTLRFEIMDKNAQVATVGAALTEMLQNGDVGVMSEAGLPGLADPGNLAVSWAHRHQAAVVPLPGASSIQMALIASGFNGQQFTFHGYLPIDKSERQKAIRKMEEDVRRSGYTQLFMETPFRNLQLLEALIQTAAPETLLCIAAGISSEAERIETRSVRDWKSALPEIHKIPCVFAIGRFPE